jgi:hypothetical protein
MCVLNHLHNETNGKKRTNRTYLFSRNQFKLNIYVIIILFNFYYGSFYTFLPIYLWLYEVFLFVVVCLTSVGKIELPKKKCLICQSNKSWVCCVCALHQPKLAPESVFDIGSSMTPPVRDSNSRPLIGNP